MIHRLSTTNPRLRPALAVALLLAGGGCTVGPEYRAPEAPDTEWSMATAPEDGGAAAMAEWWHGFEDPVLERLVRDARSGNPDIRLAVERITEAREVRAGAASGYWPQASVGASFNRRRLSENGALPAGSVPGLDIYQSVHEVGFDAGWELDVFGATRSRVRTADALVDQRSAEAADAMVLVTAEVVRNYVELRGLQQRLESARLRSDALAARLELIAAAFEAGDVTAIDVEVARLQLERARAVEPALDANLRARALALGFLAGDAPEAGLALIEASGGLPELYDVPVGARVDVIRRRPDIRAAERRLAAASHAVNVAVANRFPRLVIGAGGGYESLDPDSLFDAASQTFSIVPAISWNFFNGGRTSAAVRENESRVRQAAIAYDAAVNGALFEAERALAGYRSARERAGLLAAARDAAGTAWRRAGVRYAAGDIRRASYLEAEVEALSAADEYAAAHADAAVQLVALYKSLGGGLPTAEETASLAANR